MNREPQLFSCLNLVSLESRETPALFDVTSQVWNQNVENTLPWAVAQANATPEEDQITIGGGIANLIANSTVTITAPVRIQSPIPAQRVTITGSGSANKSVFQIAQPMPGVSPGKATFVGINFDGCQSVNGGAITVSAGELWVQDATFNKNQAIILSNGGAIAVSKGAALTVGGNVAFTNNSARNGGAIWAEGTVTVLNAGNTFANNSAFSGGAIASVGTGFVNINAAAFTENKAASQGGALWLTSVPPLRHTVSNTKFSGNTAIGTDVGSGGGIYISAGELTLAATDFVGNGAKISGGGLYAGSAKVNVLSGSFKNNYVQTAVENMYGADDVGGAIYVAANGIVNCGVNDSADPNDLGTTFGRSTVWVAKNGTFTWDHKPEMPANQEPYVVRE